MLQFLPKPGLHLRDSAGAIRRYPEGCLDEQRPFTGPGRASLPDACPSCVPGIPETADRLLEKLAENCGMRRSSLAVQPLTIVIIALFWGATAAGQQSSGWYASFDEAERIARTEGRPLLIHFQAWYCGPCKQMDAHVFHHRDVQHALQNGIVSVQIDVTREPDVASRFQAATVPRDVVVLPDGTTETINIGFVSRTAYLGLLRGIEAQGRPFQKSKPSENAVAPANSQAGTSTDTTSNGGTGGAMSPVVGDVQTDRLLGLEGFCPVALHRTREWIAGKPEWTTEYRGVAYQFASEADRDEFLKNPSRFAPQNLGCDPVVLLAAQRAITGKIQYGAFFDNQLYLFNSDENKQEFKKNPLKFTRIRHAIQAQNIEGTRFQ